MINKFTITIAITAVAALFSIGYTHGISAYLSIENQHYNNGIDQANADCYQWHTCWGYFKSNAFYGHTPDYQDGYTAVFDSYYNKNFAYCDHAAYDCTNDHPSTTPVNYGGGDNSDNQAYSNNGNTDYQQQETHVNDQHTEQNIVSPIRSSCVINCVIESAPTAGSSEVSGN